MMHATLSSQLKSVQLNEVSSWQRSGSIGSVGTIGMKNTVDLEVFIVKMFSWFA